MRAIRVLSLCLTLALLVTALSSCQKSSEPSEIGIAYPTLDAKARVVWDLMLYGDRLYLAAGDFGRNIPPERVMYFDRTTGEFSSAGEINDEQINRFLVLDGELYLPGTDPRSSWEYGTFYRLCEDRFVEYATIPHGVHNFDMCVYDGMLFSAIGTDLDSYPIVFSRDGGEHFETVPMLKDGKPVEPARASEGEVNRCYNLFTLSNGLFALYRRALYRYDPACESFVFVKEYGSFFLDADTYVPIVSDCEFGGKLFFTTMFLYRASEEGDTLSSPEEIVLPDEEKVSDLLVYGGEMFLLAFRKRVGGYTVRVYRTSDGESFEEALSFSYPVPAMSFAYDGDTFYFGMGAINQNHEKNGTLLTLSYALPE